MPTKNYQNFYLFHITYEPNFYFENHNHPLCGPYILFPNRERELIVRYGGKQSGRKWLPGGSPQGTRLGLFLFLILINAAGYGQLEKQLGQHMTGKYSYAIRG